MNKKYQKPLAIQFGDKEITSHGYCMVGSLAVGAIAQLGCTSGEVASGYGCAIGSEPQASCFVGHTASNPSGCLPGITPATSF